MWLSETNVPGLIKSTVTAKSLQLDRVRILQEDLFMPVLMDGREPIVWKKKNRSVVRAVLMGNLKSSLGIRKINTNA